MKTINDPIYNNVVPSAKEYYATYVALLALLALTTAVAYINLGAFNIVVALFIACIKSGLVIWIFMHFRTANKLVALFFGSAVAMMFVAFLLTLADYLTR